MQYPINSEEARRADMIIRVPRTSSTAQRRNPDLTVEANACRRLRLAFQSLLGLTRSLLLPVLTPPPVSLSSKPWALPIELAAAS